MRVAVAREFRSIGGLALLLLVAPVPVLGSSYYQGILAHILLFALFAVGLNVAFGHTDQLFLFVGGLAGVGAYATALLADWSGLSAWLTLLLAALLCGGIGLVVSWVSAKRRFTVILIAILTLNLQLVFSEVFVGARDLTGGSTGFPFAYLSFSPAVGLIGLPHSVILYYLIAAVLIAALFGYVALVHSRAGLAFHAIREDEVAAAAIGINVVRYKTLAGFVAAAVIGLVGALLAREASYITPSIFSFLAVDVVVLTALIVGGLRTTLGPVIGATIVIVLHELLAAATQWRTAIFGALLILLFLYFRSGVVRSFADHLPGGPADSRGEPGTLSAHGSDAPHPDVDDSEGRGNPTEDRRGRS